MDLWKYFWVTHRDHLFCNPTHESKVDEIIELLRLPEDARVLELACGKGEFLARVVERWKARGVGVDLSPYCVEEAREKVSGRGLGDRIELVHEEGSRYDAPEGAFDLTVCLGASWIFGGHPGTLAALEPLTKPGGLVLVGEPHWRCEPSPEYLASEQLKRESFGTHESNVRTGVDQGLVFLHSIVSSEDDWDRYEGYQWQASERYAVEHPDDPEAAEIVERCRKYRDEYLRWGRNELGWAIYLFARPPQGA